MSERDSDGAGIPWVSKASRAVVLVSVGGIFLFGVFLDFDSLSNFFTATGVAAVVTGIVARRTTNKVVVGAVAGLVLAAILGFYGVGAFHQFRGVNAAGLEGQEFGAERTSEDCEVEAFRRADSCEAGTNCGLRAATFLSGCLTTAVRSPSYCQPKPPRTMRDPEVGPWMTERMKRRTDSGSNEHRYVLIAILEFCS